MKLKLSLGCIVFSLLFVFSAAFLTGCGDDPENITPEETTPAKQDGAAASAPTLASRTDTSITINAVTVNNGQAVEYGINTANSAPVGWQEGLTFSGLTPSTQYYILIIRNEKLGIRKVTPRRSVTLRTK